MNLKKAMQVDERALERALSTLRHFGVCRSAISRCLGKECSYLSSARRPSVELRWADQEAVMKLSERMWEASRACLGLSKQRRGGVVLLSLEKSREVANKLGDLTAIGMSMEDIAKLCHVGTDAIRRARYGDELTHGSYVLDAINTAHRIMFEGEQE